MENLILNKLNDLELEVKSLKELILKQDAITNSTTRRRAKSIEKEDICGLKFPKNDVLLSQDEIEIRYLNLERALKLGNLEHNKIKIVFEDDAGVKQVETTVWGVTDKRVILKQGVLIPIHRIHEIR